MNLFQSFFTALKSKFASIVSKIRLFFNWNFLKTQVFTRIRNFFVLLLDVRPKHKRDYYSVGRWLVSKRLVFLIVILVGILSLWYVTANVSSMMSSDGGKVAKTYYYNHVLLRFAKGNVRIKAKSGYIAYEGDVENGAVKGNGTLYNKNGGLVYKGAFSDNKFQGQGTDYYENGSMRYSGNFENNLYFGQGKFYRSDGSLEYSGEFEEGMKNGEGELYDNSSSKVYTGNFSYDSIVYSDLLSVTTEEVNEKYKGKKTVYNDENYFAVLMSDISAMYIGNAANDSLDGKVTTTSVYVMKDYFCYGKNKAVTIDEVRNLLGEEIYHGNSEVIMPEAVVINYLNDTSRGKVLKGTVEMDVTRSLDDVITVDSFDKSYEVYLYSFEKGGLRYDFVTMDPDGGFAFYSINPTSSG